ncbi:MAG: hypothetical protein RIS47_1679, partial [Bacteroidota bacterium]
MFQIMSRKRHKKSQLIAILLLIASTAMGQINQDEWQKTINKGKLEYATENFVTASEYFEEAAKLIPTDTLAHVFLLDCGLRLRKPEIVEKAFKRLQTIGNSQPEYFAKLASVQRTVSHNFPSALATLQDGKKLFPTDKGLAYEELLWYFTKPDLKRLKPLLETFLQK